jgi:hypothetical protein
MIVVHKIVLDPDDKRPTRLPLPARCGLPIIGRRLNGRRLAILNVRRQARCSQPVETHALARP